MRVCRTPTKPAVLAILSIATHHCAVSATARACFPDAKRFCRKHGKNHGAVLSCLRYVDLAALLFQQSTASLVRHTMWNLPTRPRFIPEPWTAGNTVIS